MGNTLTNSLKDLISSALSGFRNKEARIVLIGLDGAGKTSLLYKLKLDEEVVTIPTIGFNVETIRYKKVEFTMWDLGGQKKIRSLWRHYFRNTDAIIFMVDANDRDRMDVVRAELEATMSDEHLKESKLLLLANKQDLPYALGANEIANKLKLNQICSNKQEWFVQPTIAIRGDGIFDGLDWLAAKL